MFLCLPRVLFSLLCAFTRPLIVEMMSSLLTVAVGLCPASMRAIERVLSVSVCLSVCHISVIDVSLKTVCCFPSLSFDFRTLGTAFKSILNCQLVESETLKKQARGQCALASSLLL